MRGWVQVDSSDEPLPPRHDPDARRRLSRGHPRRARAPAPTGASADRMRVIARNGGIFFDSATATEIILQTERLRGTIRQSQTAATGAAAR